MKTKNGINKACLGCGTEFYVPAYRIDTAKFCSLECQNHKQYTNRSTFNCEHCKKEFLDSPSRKTRRFCSIECKNALAQDNKERRKRSKSLSKLNRGSTSSRSLRKHIFRIKEKKCEICGYDEYDFCLDLHHIDENPNNNILDNIAILCCMCHKKLHKGIITYATKEIKV
jgi:hypothetical protein